MPPRLILAPRFKMTSFDPFKLNGLEVLRIDDMLAPYQDQLKNRWSAFLTQLYSIDHELGGFDAFTDYTRYGFYVQTDSGNMQITSLDYDRINSSKTLPMLVYREWIGNGKHVAIVGDFNGWNNMANCSEEQVFGVFTIKIPFIYKNGKYEMPIPEGSKYKIFIGTHGGEQLFRHPQHCLYATLNKQLSQYEPVWHSMPAFAFRNAQPYHEILRIYETHIGMSSEEEKVNSFREFADNILPKVIAKHYNAIYIMAVQEHAYYGSFGYQVTSFFAPSSRFGPPEDFQYLVEKAHGMGLLVFLDLVHSHASKNEADGISRWDGTDFFFQPGDHPLWDSKVFNYTHPECLRFLLQNLRFWLDVFNIDGFRFDGCMSMMYWHRSAGVGYTGRYGEYFDDDCRVDIGALVYLRLAHLLFRRYEEEAHCKITSIAEDVSGYPTLASPLEQGGLGFDYRFYMAVPDLWISMMKHGFDIGLNDFEAVDMGKIRHALCNRRWQERHIVYCECHDQALVGDKVLLMWLLNEKIYTDMSALNNADERTNRGIRLHKVIRLITIGLGGEGYLAFMGNEFGHPEWIDFPRIGNGESYLHCRRYWSLEDQNHTKYHWLSLFDKALMSLDEKYEWQRGREFVTLADNLSKLIIWDRCNLLFCCSFHPFNSDYEAILPVRNGGAYKVILTTNALEFGGDGQGTQAGNILQASKYDYLSVEERACLNGHEYFLKVWVKKQCGYVFVRE